MNADMDQSPWTDALKEPVNQNYAAHRASHKQKEIEGNQTQGNKHQIM